MIEHFQMAPMQNLFGTNREVLLRVETPYATIRGLIVSKRQLDVARANEEQYVQRCRDVGINESVIQKHLCTIFDPPKIAIAIGPDDLFQPNKTMIQFGTSARVPSLRWNPRKKGAPIDVAASIQAVRLISRSLTSAAGLTAADVPSMNVAYQKIAKAIGPARFFQQSSGNTSSSGAIDVAVGRYAQYFGETTRPHNYPGFTTWVNNSNYVCITHFTGQPAAAFIGHGWSLSDPGPATNATKARYMAFLATHVNSIFDMHRQWQGLEDPAFPELVDESTGPGALLASINYDGIGRDLDFTCGSDLFFIGTGASLEYLKIDGGPLSVASTSRGVELAIVADEIKGHESDMQASNRFAVRSTLDLSLDWPELSTSVEGCAFRIHPPVEIVNMDFKETELWKMIDKAHDAAPDYVPSPESVVYARFTEKGRQITIKYGDLLNVVPLLQRKPFLRSISVASSQITQAAVRNAPWETVVRAPASYKIGVKKESTGLYTSGRVLVKAITSGDLPYLAAHGVPLWFPDASNADPDLKFAESDFRAALGITTEPFAEVFSDFKWRDTSEEEDRMQMCLSDWVAADGGIPDPRRALVDDYDRGVRYLHALHARDRSAWIARVWSALGMLTTELRVEQS